MKSADKRRIWQHWAGTELLERGVLKKSAASGRSTSYESGPVA